MARKRHSNFEFCAQQLQYMVYPIGSVCRKPPKNWTPNQNCTCSQSQRFQYISATTYPPVQIDLTASIDSFDNFGQCLDTGNSSIKLTPTMVRDDDAIYSMLNRQYRILRRKNTF